MDRITIYRMIEDGRLPGFKVGGQWRFSRQEIEGWLLEQRGQGEVGGSASANDYFSSGDQALPLSCVQAVQGLYAEALDVAAVTVGPDGSPLTAISNSCEFCNLILSTEEGRRRCSVAWRQADGDTPHHCHAGLLCVAKHVDLQEEHVAFVAACQFVVDGDWQPDLEHLAVDLGINVERLGAAAVDVRVLPQRDPSRAARLLGRVADTFAQIAEERASLVGRLQHIAQVSKI